MSLKQIYFSLKRLTNFYIFRIQALIEREWLQGGYPFSTRHKHSCYVMSQNRSKNCGTTFTLFLDCVYQLHSQFPCSFEFESHFLILLFEHSYYSQFGTFLGDSEMDRISYNVYTKTTSLWSYVNRPDILNSYLNSMYEPNASVIWPSVAPISLMVWSDLYLRWVIDQNITKDVLMKKHNFINYRKELRSKATRFRKQLLDLYKEYQEIEDE